VPIVSEPIVRAPPACLPPDTILQSAPCSDQVRVKRQSMRSEMFYPER
jgi:hypothetical protein